MEKLNTKELISSTRKLFIENRRLSDEVRRLQRALDFKESVKNDSDASLAVQDGSLVITIKTKHPELKCVVDSLVQHAVG